MTSNQRWPHLLSARLLRPPMHDAGRSVALVRVVTGLVLVAHPINTLRHPDLLRELGGQLAADGLPFATPLALAASCLLVACSFALVVGRFVVAACAGSIFVLAAGIAFLYAPYWYVAGGDVVDGHPGVEFNVLLIACLSGVLWTHARPADPDREGRARVGLAILVTSAAALLLPHALSPFVTRDVEGMRQFGEAIGRLGFPLGVPLVWGVVSLQTVSSFLIFARRLMVPACLGHIVVLANGVWISHYPYWFVVGPENGGMEFPLVFITCFVAGALAYWPKSENAPATEAAAISA